MSDAPGTDHRADAPAVASMLMAGSELPLESDSSASQTPGRIVSGPKRAKPLKDESLPPGLRRERKGLLVATSVLLLYEIADVTIVDVQAGGAKMVLGRPEVVPVLIWIVCLYFLMRYVQFLPSQASDFTVARRWLLTLRLSELFHRERLRNAVEGPQLPSDSIHPLWLKWRWLRRSVLSGQPGAAGQKMPMLSVRVNPLAIAWAYSRSFVRVVFLTPIVTDRWLPIALALGALAYAAWPERCCPFAFFGRAR